jgi:hypothetical protein
MSCPLTWHSLSHLRDAHQVCILGFIQVEVSIQVTELYHGCKAVGHWRAWTSRSARFVHEEMEGHWLLHLKPWLVLVAVAVVVVVGHLDVL